MLIIMYLWRQQWLLFKAAMRRAVEFCDIKQENKINIIIIYDNKKQTFIS